MLEQTFMIEIFSGTATLSSVAKQNGTRNSMTLDSMALDKVKKKGAKATTYVFDILISKDLEWLYNWLDSPLLAWVHCT